MSQSSGDRSVFRLEGRIKNVLRVCQYVGVGFIIALMILTVANSVGRYGFDQPILGTIELSQYLLLTSAFLVGAYTMIVKSHVSVGIIVDRFSERTQAIIDSFTYIFGLAVTIAAVWQSLSRGIYIMHAGQATAILGIPNFPFYYIIAAGWGVLGLAIIVHLAHLLPRAVKR